MNEPLPITPIVTPPPPSVMRIFTTFLGLGCTSFGGPVAHLGYFNHELIKQRRWMSQSDYNHIMGLCHFIPGPTSSQVGLAIGYELRQLPGALAAWLGFTLPSALLMALIGLGLLQNGQLFSSATIHYLKIVALAVVAQAIWQMSKTLLTSHLMRGLCLVSTGLLLVAPHLSAQFMILLVMGGLGYYILQPETIDSSDKPSDKPNRRSYKILLAGSTVFFGLLLVAPFIALYTEHSLLTLFNSFYRSGALVFGGGHVVLPLLEQEVANHSTMSSDALLTGYSLAQAVPGPLFTFATYLGTLWFESAPILGAVIATLAIFLPSFILIPSILPIWQSIQYQTSTRGVLAGLHCAVIGLLISVFYQPLLTSTVLSIQDAAIALAMFAALHFLRCPAWLLVIGVLTAGISALL